MVHENEGPTMPDYIVTDSTLLLTVHCYWQSYRSQIQRN